MQEKHRVVTKSLLHVTTLPIAGYTFQSILHPIFKGSALTAGAKFSKGKHLDVQLEIRDSDENAVITHCFGNPLNLFLLP